MSKPKTTFRIMDDDEPAFSQPIINVEDLPVVDAWLDLPLPPIGALGPSLPYDGRPVLVTADLMVAHPAVWRVTRKFNPATKKLEPTAFWSAHNSGGQRLPFEPVAWRELRETWRAPERTRKPS